MKRISKILSVLMVAVLLFSFAAVPASAAIAHDSESTIKYVFKDALDGNVITKAEKGDTVYLYVVLNWNKNVLNFQGTFKWDKNVLTLIRRNGSTTAITNTTQTYGLCGDFASAKWVELTDADGDMFYQDDDNNMMGGYTTYGAGTKTFNHTYNAAAWDDAKKEQYQAYTFIYTSNLDDTTNQLLVNTHGEDLEFCYMCFKVNEDTDLTEAVISDDEQFGVANLIDVTNDQSWYFVPYAKTSFTTYTITPVPATLTIGSSAPIVYHVKDQIQWADKAAGKVNLGIVAGFNVEDINIQFNEKGTSTNVDKVGAVVTINNETKDYYEQFVYSATNNGKDAFYFRTVIAGVDKNYSGNIVVTPLVWMTGEETPIYGDPITITAADLANYVAKLPA